MQNYLTLIIKNKKLHINKIKITYEDQLKTATNNQVNA